mmetsp:Transcript_16835/g.31890  ORF Transcript_16835/g.31890 Transcript_16835/m.31890 type:complete len:212 (-) Transcript_16835:2323-2958(-)
MVNFQDCLQMQAQHKRLECCVHCVGVGRERNMFGETKIEGDAPHDEIGPSATRTECDVMLTKIVDGCILHEDALPWCEIHFEMNPDDRVCLTNLAEACIAKSAPATVSIWQIFLQLRLVEWCAAVLLPAPISISHPDITDFASHVPFWLILWLGSTRQVILAAAAIPDTLNHVTHLVCVPDHLASLACLFGHFSFAGLSLDRCLVHSLIYI